VTVSAAAAKAGSPVATSPRWQASTSPGSALDILEDLQHPDAGQARARLASTCDRAFPDLPA
jgi:hypothetical protein